MGNLNDMGDRNGNCKIRALWAWERGPDPVLVGVWPTRKLSCFHPWDYPGLHL